MKVVRRPEITAGRSLYLSEITSGMILTAGHALKNLFNPARLITVSYPEETKELPPATRGRHRLMKREDGSTRCTACMLCATNCPAECIHIQAAESDDPRIEKFPQKFDIDLLRCVYCGLCVEACPLDAIRMDVPLIALADYTRESFIMTKEKLLNHSNEEFVKDYNPPRPRRQTHGEHDVP